MTGSIVSPWIIYLISLFNSICITCDIFSVLGTITLVVFYIIRRIEINDTIYHRYTEEEAHKHEKIKIKRLHRQFRLPIVILFIILSCAFIIPDKETSIQMLIAQHVTYENVEKFTDYVNNITNNVLKEDK